MADEIFNESNKKNDRNHLKIFFYSQIKRSNLDLKELKTRCTYLSMRVSVYI